MAVERKLFEITNAVRWSSNSNLIAGVNDAMNVEIVGRSKRFITHITNEFLDASVRSLMLREILLTEKGFRTLVTVEGSPSFRMDFHVRR